VIAVDEGSGGTHDDSLAHSTVVLRPFEVKSS